MISTGRDSVLRLWAQEPYRFFFLLAPVSGMIGIGHWIFYAMGWIPHYSMIFHSSIQIHAYIGAFVFGFLLTALPRFSSSPPCTRTEFFTFVFLMISMIAAYGNMWFTAGRICFALMLLDFVFFALRRFKQKRDSAVVPPVEFLWLPTGILSALTGVLLSLVAQSSVSVKLSKLLIEQAFLLSIVVGIGSFLGPRLMGTFKTAAGPIPESPDVRNRRRALWIHSGYAFLLLLSFLIEAFGRVRTAFFLRSAVVMTIYIRSGALVRRPLANEDYVWMLWMSFWMVTMGHAAIAFFPAFRTLFLHLVFLGGYSAMTFAVGTMVIFSHGGKPQALRKRSWRFRGTFVFLIAATVVRLISVMFPFLYFQFLAAASVLWFLSGLFWLLYVAPLVFSFPGQENFEQCHDEAKQRIANLSRDRHAL